jgi:hypothetical protein
MPFQSFPQFTAMIQTAEAMKKPIPTTIHFAYEAARIMNDLGDYTKWRYWETQATLESKDDTTQRTFWKRQYITALTLQGLYNRPQEERAQRVVMTAQASSRAHYTINKAETLGHISFDEACAMRNGIHMVADELLYWNEVTQRCDVLRSAAIV